MYQSLILLLLKLINRGWALQMQRRLALFELESAATRRFVLLRRAKYCDDLRTTAIGAVVGSPSRVLPVIATQANVSGGVLLFPIITDELDAVKHLRAQAPLRARLWQLSCLPVAAHHSCDAFHENSPVWGGRKNRRSAGELLNE